MPCVVVDRSAWISNTTQLFPTVDQAVPAVWTKPGNRNANHSSLTTPSCGLWYGIPFLCKANHTSWYWLSSFLHARAHEKNVIFRLSDLRKIYSMFALKTTMAKRHKCRLPYWRFANAMPNAEGTTPGPLASDDALPPSYRGQWTTSATKINASSILSTTQLQVWQSSL